MKDFTPDLNLILVYFIYGLAFFSMGIALALETGRSPRLAERRVLRPLALFGLLHGTYEWLELYMILARWMNITIHPGFSWFQVGWLALSFIPLVLFGVLSLNRSRALKYFEVYLGGLLILVCVFLGMVAFFTTLSTADVLARYFLAVPGAALAATALIVRSKNLAQEGRVQVSRSFFRAGLSFGLYGFTQFYGPAAEFFPASFLNSVFFEAVIGIPVQAVRSGAAVLVMINLIRAMQYAERERTEQLLSAQQERMSALERVQQELIFRESMRRELLRHIVIAQEDERARISRELHDETAQILTAFSLELATLRTMKRKSTTEIQILERLLNLSRQMSQGLYRLVHDLRPAQLDDLGLAPALQHLLDDSRRRMQLEVSLEVTGTRQRLDPLMEIVIFRVAQESLTNIKRHADTPKAEMVLAYSPAQITLQVRDQGSGFDPHQELRPPHGWGLAGMRERAESVGGRLDIRSAPGQGTVIKLVIPLLPPEPLAVEENSNGRTRYPLNVS